MARERKCSKVGLVLGLITARGGSRGIARKNVRLVAGKPLIAWTAEAAFAATRLSRTVLSTDDKEIADVARRLGLEVPFMRPDELAGPASPHIDVVLHTLGWLEQHEGFHPEYLVLLQPTSPLRVAQDIDDAVELATSKNAEAVVSVVDAPSHPYLVYRPGPGGYLVPFVDVCRGYVRRQDMPPAYALNGAVYVVRCDVLLREKTLLPAATLPLVMPPDRSVDIDTPWDLELADWALRRRAERTTPPRNV